VVVVDVVVAVTAVVVILVVVVVVCGVNIVHLSSDVELDLLVALAQQLGCDKGWRGKD
jgi:hypothetical protein